MVVSVVVSVIVVVVRVVVVVVVAAVLGQRCFVSVDQCWFERWVYICDRRHHA